MVVVPVNDRWFPKGCLWYGLQSAICVIRTTMRQRHPSEFPAQEVHYYLSSLKPDAGLHDARIRSHWEVENSCHYLLDVTQTAQRPSRQGLPQSQTKGSRLFQHI